MQPSLRHVVAPITLALVILSPTAVAQTTDGMQAARDYCESVGGSVVERRATWNTNADTSAWVDLGRSMEVCRFQTLEEDDSRISVDIWTLYSEAPSLAAAAYLSRTPVREDLPPANPATIHCADLGGSSQFGSGAAGGGWVWMEAPIDTVLAMCVFPDGSAIDEWGITYYADGVVRGADLAPLFRSDIEDYPPIFP
jgi:putative hemolysin